MEPFRTFKEPDEAEHIAGWLADHGIDVVTKRLQSPYESPIHGTAYTADYEVRIPAEDFTRADTLLKGYYIKQLDTLDQDYYLFSFTDNELIDIIRHPDQWGDLDYILAHRLLKERGIEVDDEQIKILKDQRIKELAKPEKTDPGLIYAGYASLIAGGLLGMMIGWYIVKSTKMLPDGSKVQQYSIADRVHGYRMVYVGIVWCCIFLLYVFYRSYLHNSIIT